MSYTYNPDGTVATKTDAKNVTLTYVCNEKQQLQSENFSGAVHRKLYL